LIKFLAESQQQQQATQLQQQQQQAAAQLQQQQQLVQQLSTQQQQLLVELGRQNREHQQQCLQQLATMLPRSAEPQSAGATGSPSAAPPVRLTKMGPTDDPEAFLVTFERVALVAGWAPDQWATLLAPYLT
ncbi:SCAN domain-containing protein 1-like, partial [Chelydra serpentina]